ncbi:MAG: threonylcarbamoyl-AMP synthase [Candidatus Marinimicrobia bacterium]|nr:threonylcarbamoyl-AMP synthase [Candidatus Neomarinimicrobiota bacterium]MCF7839264.1 threonylcarbamoyl-AMP synthase [Candidatus Neomarinimicrobiota bacterium]MCF7902865.1 threonylcarbamoyl-AMP synthase [Candidatus Neomarinimicrobiota bacterium]
MQIIEINPDGQASGEAIDAACQILAEGGIIGYPTDTLYGLGVDSTNTAAVQRLYELKNRSKVPMSVMLASVDDLLKAIENRTPAAEKLIREFLPGQLTIVAHCNLGLADGIESERGLTGLRVPDHPLNLRLVEAFGRPITSTSANLSGYPSALNIETIIAYFSDQVDLLFDYGTLSRSQGSTVIDISQSPFEILREGVIPVEKLADYLT